MVNAPAGYGDLPQLARLALQPKSDRIEAGLELRDATTNHLKPASTQTRPETHNATESLRSFRQDIRRADPPPVKENPRYAEADVLRLQSRLKSSEERLASVQSNEQSFHLPMSRSQDQSRLSSADLHELMALQLEIRSLRKDISNISSALRKVGVISKPATADSRSTEAALIERSGYSNEASQTLKKLIRNQESAKISDRQRMLLSALRRVERKLASAPQDSQAASEHGQVIGDIYKVRFSIASFPVSSAGSMLGGMLFDSAA